MNPAESSSHAPSNDDLSPAPEERRQPEPLDELAERAGIELSYRDANGKCRRPSAAVKRRLLAAMGIPATAEEEVHASLSRLEESKWRRQLPAVCVVHGHLQAPTLELVATEGQGRVRWCVQLESGRELRGEVDFGALPLIESRSQRGARMQRRAFVLEADLEPGYHELQVEGWTDRTRLIVSPGKCWLPTQVEAGARLWGVTCQLYALRSAASWGIGDFSDLATLLRLVCRSGGDLVGINPLHALFPDEPRRASPYSPSSRLLLNVLNVDVTAVHEFAVSPAVQQSISTDQFQALLARCREAKLVDYETVAQLKRPLLRELFKEFIQRGAESRKQEFESWRSSRTGHFARACVFQALREHLVFLGYSRDPAQWPPEYQSADCAGVGRFATEHAHAITEMFWMQWIAEVQLREAVAAAPGMSVGLYRDLAVGVDASGAETWSDPAATVAGVHIGAPPDIFNPAGQDWGLPPLHPHRLKQEGYATFIELLRANMRHCGGLRVDHVMALRHLYWVPAGLGPAEGAYVRYPLEDLLSILALESHRQRCLVVGEDLGTVPEGFRDRMTRARVLSYRIVFFEQDADTADFVPPERYPRLAIAATGSHDLPSLRAWWNAEDLDLKERLGLFAGEGEQERARHRRERDRSRLRDALRRARLVDSNEELTVEVLLPAMHRFLARSACALAVAQLEDLAGQSDPVNLPSTADIYPNWRVRLPLCLEQIADSEALATVAGIFREVRGGG